MIVTSRPGGARSRSSARMRSAYAADGYPVSSPPTASSTGTSDAQMGKSLPSRAATSGSS
eukprot:scaffold113431_cov42-Phaeocystis_antarctica.AAC.1